MTNTDQSTEQSEHIHLQLSVSRGCSLQYPQPVTTARSDVTDLHGGYNNLPHAENLKQIQMGQGHTKLSGAAKESLHEGLQAGLPQASVFKILNMYKVWESKVCPHRCDIYFISYFPSNLGFLFRIFFFRDLFLSYVYKHFVCACLVPMEVIRGSRIPQN